MTVTVPQAMTELTATAVRPRASVDRLVSGAVVVFLAVVALLPWPAALGGAVAVVVSLALGSRGRSRPPARGARAFAVVCVALLASALLSSIVHPGGLHALRVVAQFSVLAAVACAFCVAPRSGEVLGAVWTGVTAGAVLAGVTAPVVVVLVGASRAAGIGGHAIAFGNLALLMGVASIALAPLAHQGPFRLPERVISVAPAVAVLAGVLASALSGSRGGWLAAPVMAILLITHRRRGGTAFPRRVATLVVAAAIAGVALGGGMPVERLADAPADVGDYVGGDLDRRAGGTTIGARFEAWRSAGQAFTESPVLGIGWGNLPDHFRDAVDRGERHPRIAEFEHAHQQLLGALASGGLIGGAAVVAVVAIPAAAFRRARGSASVRDRAVGTAGLLVVASYVVFGLTEGILDNLAPVSFFGVMVGALASQIDQVERPGSVRPARSRPADRTAVPGRRARALVPTA
jgi:O-antigen ligase